MGSTAYPLIPAFLPLRGTKPKVKFNALQGRRDLKLPGRFG